MRLLFPGVKAYFLENKHDLYITTYVPAAPFEVSIENNKIYLK